MSYCHYKQKLKIQDLELNSPFIAGPMVHFSHIVYRELLGKLGGAGAVFTEMLDENILLKEDLINSPWTKIHGSSPPTAHQLLTTHPDKAVKAILKLTKNLPICWIDINMGCPAPHIKKREGGAMIMENTTLAKDIIQAIRSIYKGPLTVKIRTGIKEDLNKTIRFINLLEENQVDGIIYHPRLFGQKLKARSKWNYFHEIAKETSLPLIGNGDISSPEEAIAHLEEYPVSGIMISRQYLITPWIFNSIQSLSMKEPSHKRPKFLDIWDMFCLPLNQYFNPKEAHERLTKWSVYFSKNFLFGHQFWVSIKNSKSFEEAVQVGRAFIQRNTK